MRSSWRMTVRPAYSYSEGSLVGLRCACNVFALENFI